MRRLRIAMIGQKGIPARYGGVETHVENIAVRLAARGHEVTAFCRSRYRPADGALPDGFVGARGHAEYRGVRLLYRASVNTKHLDAASHAFLCALEAGTRHGFDIVHLHGIGPAAFAPVAKLLGRPVVSTFHALDWRQVKWGARAKSVLRRGEAVGARRSDGIIAVSQIMKQHVREAHGLDATHIPNGASPREPRGTGSIGRWGLRGDDYILTVGRIIRDREIHTLIEAFRGLDEGLRLVVVGSENPRTAYTDELERAGDGRVVFTGEVFGDGVEDLYANCRVFVLASRVEGLPISVCEAMAHGRALVLSDIPENREVGGDAARFFKCGDSNSLHNTLEDVLQDGAARAELGRRGVERVRETYNWEAVTDRVESFYYQVLER
jgi:glycosyltransferase involved in cell wall biosynthesis